MSSGQRKKKHPFNDTIIRDGMIVRIRKDGSIKSILGEYTPNHNKGGSNVRNISTK